MSVNAAKAFQYETEFLSGVGANFEAAKGSHFRGSIWQSVRDNEEERLRALLSRNKLFDRELLKSLPANRRLVLRGSQRRLGFWTRPTGVAIASVLSPLSHYVSSREDGAPPITLSELTDHVRRLVRDPKVPHVIGVCSPSGFTEEARQGRVGLPNATVVLIEPDGHDGWRTSATDKGVDERLLRIFDPEAANLKVERVRRFIEEGSAELLTGGLSVSAVVKRTNLSEAMVRRGFSNAADQDPELRLTEFEGEMLLFRGAPTPARERKPMNVIDRIRQLFSREGDEAEKTNMLAERRAALSVRRDRIYADIGKLEKKEAELFAEGKAAPSQVPRRRIAAQLAQMRKDIARHNTSAAMLNQQINIISTDIHNLTLIQQGKLASLPDTAELTENAVRAEEMLETLKADADLVGSLESGIEATIASDEEQAILREFEQADQPAQAKEQPIAAPTETTVSLEAQPDGDPQGADESGINEPASDEPGEKERRRGAEPS